MGVCTVHIWKGGKFGHASMTIGENGSYVSWWPGKSNKGKEGANMKSLLPYIKHASEQPLTLKQDIEWEDNEIPESYSLVFDELDEAEMEKYYLSHYAGRKASDYQLARQNCSTMVIKVLKAGGAHHVEQMPRVSVWTPDRVESYVRKLKAKTDGAKKQRARAKAAKYGRKVF